MKFISPAFALSLLFGLAFATGAVAGSISEAELQARIWQVSNKGRCKADCTSSYQACKRQVEIDGDRLSWDGDLRQDAHDNKCVPARTTCLAKC